jgi:hypothetical protein
MCRSSTQSSPAALYPDYGQPSPQWTPVHGRGVRSTANALLARGHDEVIVLCPSPEPGAYLMGGSLVEELANQKYSTVRPPVFADSQSESALGSNPVSLATRAPAAGWSRPGPAVCTPHFDLRAARRPAKPDSSRRLVGPTHSACDTARGRHCLNPRRPRSLIRSSWRAFRVPPSRRSTPQQRSRMSVGAAVRGTFGINSARNALRA